MRRECALAAIDSSGLLGGMAAVLDNPSYIVAGIFVSSLFAFIGVMGIRER